MKIYKYLKSSTAKPKGRKKFEFSQEVIAFFGLLVISISLSFASPYFLTISNTLNIGRQAAINLIIALGMTVVIISGGIDLSVGSIVALTAVTMNQLWERGIIPNIWVAMVIGIIAATIVGLINGLIIHYGKVPPFITTLGMMGICRGLALLITRGYTTVMGFPDDFQWIGAGEILGIPFPLLLAALLAILFHLLLKYTKIGRSYYAIGGNQEAARLSGIRVGQVKIAAYTTIGFCCGVAGIVLASRINSAPPAAGTGYELNAIAAVILGGTNLFGGEGTVVGTVIGAILMAVIGNGLNLLNVNPFWQQIVIGIVIILAVMASTIRQKQQ